MRRSLILAAIAIAAATWMPATASAQAWRHYRYGPAMTVYGPVYNPVMSPEYRLWAQNPAAYEQMMLRREQQAMQKQQQEFQKQQQAFQKWLKEQKALKDKGKPTDPAYDRMVREQEAALARQAMPRRRSTHRRPATARAAAAAPK